MSTALEIVGALILTGTLVAGLAILTALEFGRMISRDDEQQEVEMSDARPQRLKNAA